MMRPDASTDTVAGMFWLMVVSYRIKSLVLTVVRLIGALNSI